MIHKSSAVWRAVVFVAGIGSLTAVLTAGPAGSTRAARAPVSLRSVEPLRQGQRGGFAAPQNQPPEPLRFRYMGPAPAGRIASVVGVPGDPTTYYLGNASGGVWKSTDSGATFMPV